MIDAETNAGSTARAGVLETIQRRRSNARTLPISPVREEIEQMLIAANAAPNHHLTQPWRFCVARGAEVGRIAEAIGKDTVAMMGVTDAAQVEGTIQAARVKFARAPVVIVAAVAPVDEHPKSIDWEDFAATAAAMQNMLLAAESLGLAAIWRSSTSELTHLKSLLGLRRESKVIGFLHVGYPDPSDLAPQKPRRPHTDFVEWRGWDD